MTRDEIIKDCTNLSSRKMADKYGISHWRARRCIHMVKTNNIDLAYLDSIVRSKDIIKDPVILDDPNSIYLVKGKSTLVDDEGNVKLTWVKESLDTLQYQRVLTKVVEDMVSRVAPRDPIKSVAKFHDNDLMTLYPLPDLHWGLLVCGEETNHGMNYDLHIASDWVEQSHRYLIENSPKSHTAVIVDLGDFLHSEDDNNLTIHSKHSLDVDQRHFKIVRAAFETTIRMIEMALAKHKEVVFYSVKGNHSELSSVYLKAYLSAYFKDEPRLKVIQKESMQQYHIWGKNILGFSHGHTLKPERAAETLVYDNQKIISDSEYRYFHFGHYHSNRMFTTPMVEIEVHRNITPRDAWSEGMGFRGTIGMSKSITYHKEYGEVARNTYNIKRNSELIDYPDSH